MRRSWKAHLVCVLLFSFLAVLACAAPGLADLITWNLSGVTLEGGGFLNGYFVYDTANKTVTDWSILEYLSPATVTQFISLWQGQGNQGTPSVAYPFILNPSTSWANRLSAVDMNGDNLNGVTFSNYPQGEVGDVAYFVSLYLAPGKTLTSPSPLTLYVWVAQNGDRLFTDAEVGVMTLPPPQFHILRYRDKRRSSQRPAHLGAPPAVRAPAGLRPPGPGGLEEV
jgi:hypothetical protein